jgi:hypothetical protein
MLLTAGVYELSQMPSPLVSEQLSEKLPSVSFWVQKFPPMHGPPMMLVVEQSRVVLKLVSFRSLSEYMFTGLFR